MNAWFIYWAFTGVCHTNCIRYKYWVCFSSYGFFLFYFTFRWSNVCQFDWRSNFSMCIVYESTLPNYITCILITPLKTPKYNLHLLDGSFDLPFQNTHSVKSIRQPLQIVLHIKWIFSWNSQIAGHIAKRAQPHKHTRAQTFAQRGANTN